MVRTTTTVANWAGPRMSLDISAHVETQFRLGIFDSGNVTELGLGYPNHSKETHGLARGICMDVCIIYVI